MLLSDIAIVDTGINVVFDTSIIIIVHVAIYLFDASFHLHPVPVSIIKPHIGRADLGLKHPGAQIHSQMHMSLLHVQDHVIFTVPCKVAKSDKWVKTVKLFYKYLCFIGHIK